MPPPKAKRRGIGARVEVKLQHLYPREIIKAFVDERYPDYASHFRIHKEQDNSTHEEETPNDEEDIITDEIDKQNKKMREYIINQTLECTIIGKAPEKICTGRTRDCCILQSDEIPGKLYCTLRWAIVKEEGPEEHLFDWPPRSSKNPKYSNPRVYIPEEIRRISCFRREDVQLAIAMGFEVDDDELDALDDLSVEGEDDDEELKYHNQKWGWNGLDNRAEAGAVDIDASFNVSVSKLKSMDLVDAFLEFFPRNLIEDVIIPLTNEKMASTQSDLTLSEFCIFLGLWFLMACYSGGSRDEYWSDKPVSLLEGPPFRIMQLTSMTEHRFNAILKALRYTNEEKPSSPWQSPNHDLFWEVRDMIKEWNDFYETRFTPDTYLCVDKAVSAWDSEKICPGFRICPSKARQKGNVYHVISCCETGIIFRLEIEEGKQTPSNIVKEWSNFEKSTALLMRLCTTVFGSGRIVILHPQYSILRALVELAKLEVYAGAYIEKRLHWPKYVPGDEIEAKMETFKIGQTESVSGEVPSDPSVKYDIFCMKDSHGVNKIMSTYGGLFDSEDFSTRRLGSATSDRGCHFKYQTPFANHFRYRGTVDNHSEFRQLSPALEDTWDTERWADHVFAFLLATSEVNLFLSVKKAGTEREKSEFHAFRRKLALALINNQLGQNNSAEAVLQTDGDSPVAIASKKVTKPRAKQKESESVLTDHYQCSAPPNVKGMKDGEWVKSITKYAQFVCRGQNCKKKIRTYCACMPGHWLCSACIVAHILSCEKNIAGCNVPSGLITESTSNATDSSKSSSAKEVNNEGMKAVAEDKHYEKTAPPNTKGVKDGVWRYSITRYAQFSCRGPNCDGKKRIRTYCACNPGHWYCGTCLIEHIVGTKGDTGECDLQEKPKSKDDSGTQSSVLKKHRPCSAPPYTKGVDFFGEWVESKTKYAQFKCKTRICPNNVRSYCACRPAHWLCKACLLKHIVDSEEKDNE